MIHHFSWATARAGPPHVGGLMGTVDVVVVVAIVHHISWAAVRAGPSNTWAASWAGRSGPYRAHISWAAARPGPSNFQRMGRSPARPITISEDWPRPYPADHICKFLRLGPARPHHIFQTSRPGPARPITHTKVSARPGPSQFSDRPGPARPRQTAHDKP